LEQKQNNDVKRGVVLKRCWVLHGITGMNP